MLFKALELIRQNLDAFLKSSKTPTPAQDQVVLGNIAFSTPDNSATANLDESAQLYMSMVNVEEELTFKNQSAIRHSTSSVDGVEYINPPFHLNLYILFTANHKNYSDALKDLSLLLKFFQANRVFSMVKTPVSATGVFAGNSEVDSLYIRMDLMSLTFEQINHLWGSLGGKQMPFVLFKASKIEIDAEQVLQDGGIILDININSGN